MNEQHKYKQQHLYKNREDLISNNTTDTVCSFCGSEMDEDDKFCPDCGNSREGIRCPSCGNLSRRSFCSTCNAPLNELAQQAIKDAKTDAAFLRAESIAAELHELEQKIQSLAGQRNTLDESVKADLKSIADHYERLFGSDEIAIPKVSTQKAPEISSSRVGTDLLRAAIEAYREKAEELQQTLDSMLPPAAATPEQQRNFFCARKIRSISMETVRQQWVCNFCGCYHDHPSECTRPELGGKWIMAPVPTPVTSIIYS